MSGRKTPADPVRQAQLMAGLRRDRAVREKSYREQALKLFPHICARCARELTGKRLRELTVHHKDHDHNHNPPDGSNWELLCLYCHDHEHEKYKIGGLYDGGGADEKSPASPISTPFEGLDAMLKPKKEQA